MKNKNKYKNKYKYKYKWLIYRLETATNKDPKNK